VVARDRRAPSGAGKYLLKHALGIAALTDSLQGNRALTLDPRDSLTQEMWLKQGFRRTETELDGGLRRLYAPVFGPYWGSLERPD
jgi:hypothetical protein